MHVDSLAPRMAQLAAAWLDSLDEGQRTHAALPFDGRLRMHWDYRPGERPGLAIGDMDSRQAALAMDLVDIAMSDRGAGEVRSIIAREPILGELERRAGRSMWRLRDPGRYWFAVFGSPDQAEPWGWHLTGHHVSLHVTLAGGEIAPTPLFLGANPARAMTPGGDERLLGEEEHLARTLITSLSATQKAEAIVDRLAPADILTTNAPRVDPAELPVGIRSGQLDPRQRRTLERLARHYLERSARDVAARAWSKITSGGLDQVTFAWAGPETPGSGHYYVIRAGSAVFEYDNTQDGANHVHSVWRDVDGDWGSDLLAAHYAKWHATERGARRATSSSRSSTRSPITRSAPMASSSCHMTTATPVSARAQSSSSR